MTSSVDIRAKQQGRGGGSHRRMSPPPPRRRRHLAHPHPSQRRKEEKEREKEEEERVFSIVAVHRRRPPSELARSDHRKQGKPSSLHEEVFWYFSRKRERGFEREREGDRPPSADSSPSG